MGQSAERAHVDTNSTPRPETAPIVVSEATDAAAWDAYVAAHAEGTVEHRFAWQSIFSQVFHQRPLYLQAVRGQHVAGILPLVRVRSLLFGKLTVSLPYTSYSGVLSDDAEVSAALIEKARQVARAFGSPRLELRNISRHAGDSLCRDHKVGARLTLPSTSEALWTSLDRKVRNQIRKAQKEGLAVERGGLALVPDFYTVFAENMRDLGTPVFPRQLFLSAVREIDQASVFIVRKDGVPIAGSITLGWQHRLLVPWASALRRFRTLSPNMLLYWTMLDAAIGDGYHVFDFGRSTRDGGTHDFKRQWGAEDFPLHWETFSATSAPLEAPKSSSAVDKFVDLWQRLPLGIANVLGPHVIRHVV